MMPCNGSASIPELPELMVLQDGEISSCLTELRQKMLLRLGEPDFSGGGEFTQPTYHPLDKIG